MDFYPRVVIAHVLFVIIAFGAHAPSTLATLASDPDLLSIIGIGAIAILVWLMEAKAALIHVE